VLAPPSRTEVPAVSPRRELGPQRLPDPDQLESFAQLR
jgi:hypothetical protein